MGSRWIVRLSVWTGEVGLPWYQVSTSLRGARSATKQSQPQAGRKRQRLLRFVRNDNQAQTTAEIGPISFAMTEAARINVPEWSVSELSAALKRTVEDAYGYVRVRGEISNYRGPASSGHCYFALKDEGARIDAVIWRGTFGRIKFKPEEGLEVIATGRLTTYPGRSSYQIVIDSLEPAGVGALMALLEERKKKLAAEGLFDEARKQLLPYLPDVIGVITSP